MKSIVYLSNGERRNIPRFVAHDPALPAFEIYKRTDRWLSYRESGLRYCGTIESGMGVHEKINRRADFIANTAWHVWHHHATPPGTFRHWGRDYQWYVTPQRTARSRFRHAKRQRRKGTFNWCQGYSPMDLAFGLVNDRPFDLTDAERHHLLARLDLAATSRAPLPPWCLSDCWQRQPATAAA
jgi:hypothetical protein